MRVMDDDFKNSISDRCISMLLHCGILEQQELQRERRYIVGVKKTVEGSFCDDAAKFVMCMYEVSK